MRSPTNTPRSSRKGAGSATPWDAGCRGVAAVWLAAVVGSRPAPVGATAAPLLSPQSSAAPPAKRVSGPPDQPALSRELLDRYCVSCHNERLKTAGLLLDRVNLADVQTHAGELEKVVRKLRKGTMPPVGQPRPDPASVDAFVRTLEATLDKVAASSPQPGTSCPAG